MSSSRVFIRPAVLADAEAVRDIYAPIVENTHLSFEETPPDAHEIRRRIEAAPRLPWLVVQQAEQVAGFAYASRHRRRAAYRWSADCSIYLDPRYHGRGLGRLLYERLLTELVELGYISAYAGIALPNPASVRLHEAMGFRPVGIFSSVGHKHGRWRDVGWWQRLLCEPPAHPRPPREWMPLG